MTAQQPWIDPEFLAMGALLKAQGLAAPPPHTVPLAEARAQYDAVGAFLGEGAAPLAHETAIEVSGPNGPIRCELYGPDRALRPALIYLHGGGFALGRARDWRGMLRELARAAGIHVVNVEYRLAPEHPFPAAFEEAVAVLRHLARHGGEHGIDGSRLAIGGDSAGANLALGAACAARDAAERCLRLLVLFYGVYSLDMQSASWQALGGGQYGLSRDTMAWIWNGYLQRPADRRDWRAAPLSANLAGLPPVFMNVGTLDPLQDDATALKAKLDSAGVANELRVYPGINHGFIRSGRLLGAARQAVADAAARVRSELVV